MLNNPQQNEVVPETSLIDTIGKSDLSAIGADASEVLLDQLLDNGPIRDIPIIGSIFKLTKAGIDISNYLFAKKVLLFLRQVQEIPDEQRKYFLAQMQVDQQFRQRVGENLLLLLHQLDDMQKPEMLGRIFKAYIQGTIDYVTYQKLATATDRFKTYNVQRLIDFYTHPSERQPPDEVLQDLAMAGLVAPWIANGMTIGNGSGYAKNEIGKLFIKLALNQEHIDK